MRSRKTRLPCFGAGGRISTAWRNASSLVAGKQCSRTCTEDCRPGCHRRITPVVRDHNIRHMHIDDLICIHNNIWEYFLSEQHTKNASPDCCDQCIIQIFSCDAEFSISERFERSDLRALFLDHTRHRRQTDQRRYDKEQNRKYFSDCPHTVCVIAISGILCKCTSVIDIPGGIFYLCNLLFSIFDLIFPVFDLGFGFFFAIFISFFCLGKLLFIGCDCIFTRRKFCLPGVDRFPSGINLALSF